MTKTNSPQAKEMADESMVRNLAAQALAIWPQEEPIFDRHPLGQASVLDVGCGTGEVIFRLAAKYPQASFVGVDLEEPHLERARARCAEFGDRVRFETGDATALGFDAASFDLAVCRHVLQAVPDPAVVLAEIARVLRPGGTLVGDTLNDTALAKALLVTVAERLPFVPAGIHDPDLFVAPERLQRICHDHGIDLRVRGLRPSVLDALAWQARLKREVRMLPTRWTGVLYQAVGVKR